MNIYIYSDESGTFSKNTKMFLYAGYVFLCKDDKDKYLQRFKYEEISLRHKLNIHTKELKGSLLKSRQKAKLIKKFNNVFKFCAIVNNELIYDRIFNSKRTKQRYLDFVYKLGIKNVLIKLMNKNLIKSDDVFNIFIYQDEHTTTTDAFYELKTSLLKEFKEGLIDVNGNFVKPLFKNIKNVKVNLCNSKTNVLIRASDILCNLIWNNYKHNSGLKNLLINNLIITELPHVKVDFKKLITSGLRKYNDTKNSST